MARTIASLFLSLLIVAVPSRLSAQASDQQPAAAAGSSTEVTRNAVVISSTRTTLVVKTDDGRYHLFELTADSTRPANIRVGSTVTVTSTPGENPGAPFASQVVVVRPPATAQAGQQRVGTTGAVGTSGAVGTVGTADAGTSADDAVPQSIRDLERSIKRQTSRYRVGVRAGMALDPELVTFGAQAQLGPFFSNNVWARPNLELGFGELSTLIALNLEGIYRAPISVRTSRWQTFFGGGLGLNFRNESLSGVSNSGGRFDFGNFTFGGSLNLVAGVQSRAGPFVELRASAYSTPTLRLMLGYNF